MGFQPPPLLKVISDTVKRPWFAVLLVIMMLLGFLLQQLPQTQQQLVCDLYHQQLRPGLEALVDRVIGWAPGDLSTATSTGPTTAPAKDSIPAWLNPRMKEAIEHFFCPTPTFQPLATGWHPPTLKEAYIVVPGAAILAFLAASMIPIATSRKDVTASVNTAISHQQPNSTDTEEAVLSRYPSLALGIRQFRIAIVYALLSGICTLIVRPHFLPPNIDPYDAIKQNAPHLLCLIIVAAASALWGVFFYARTELKTSQIARKLGFASIFYGGLIGMAISLPYQALRPADMQPMNESQIVTLLTIRLLVLPSTTMAICAAARGLLKRMG